MKLLRGKQELAYVKNKKNTRLTALCPGLPG